jgi:7SK snRNA methylphosphate capping enzyme
MSEEPAKKRVKLSSGSGHAIFGNYMSYYSKRKQAEGLDRRLTLLDKSWVANKRVLDVGCNSGKVTVDIAQHFQPYRCTGVDIDHQLVSLAKKQGEQCIF